MSVPVGRRWYLFFGGRKLGPPVLIADSPVVGQNFWHDPWPVRDRRRKEMLPFFSSSNTNHTHGITTTTTRGRQHSPRVLTYGMGRKVEAAAAIVM